MSKLLHSRQSAYVGQNGVSPQRRLPVDDGVTANAQQVSGETIRFYYYTSAGVLTLDAGEAAGTIVVATLTNKNVLNSLGDGVGNYGDTSFSFGTGTILTQFKPFRGLLAEDAELTGELALQAAKNRAIAVTEGFENGWYTIDHEHGVIYGKKATAGTADTGSYKVLVSGGGGTIAEQVSIKATAMQSKGLDATGQDAYATIKTPSADATHIKISLEGSFGAVISLDGGTTDHIDVPANSIIVLDAVTITSGVAIQAKNFTPGSDYSNLSVSIW